MAYLPLSTASLPDPVIDPAQGASPEDYFNTVLYSGNSTTGHAITGVGFQPDLVWTKGRSDADPNYVHDAVRTVSNRLNTAETTGDAGGLLSSFDSDGFTISSTGNGANGTGHTYVAWNWKANGSGTSIAAGSIDGTNPTIASTVSANTTSGFSIVSWVGDGLSSGKTVGHGLSQAPELMIHKSRDPSASYLNDWVVYTTVIDGTLDFMYLNTTGAKNNSGFALPTSTVFTPMNADVGDNMIGYCFHSVEGFSKFGSYVGNGSTDGPFVYTGFRPAFVMMKKSNNTSNWSIVDSKRIDYNPDNYRLYPNLSNAEVTTDMIDLLSNGFKLKADVNDNNASGDTYIYMAFAENPFKYSNAR